MNADDDSSPRLSRERLIELTDLAISMINFEAEWRNDNREALDSSNDRIKAAGLPLAGKRLF